jgi:hypothetical protein
MASARRTFDTDSITLRTVFAKNGDNTNIPALQALTADGTGGTYWRQPSSFGTNPSFNTFNTTAGTFTADLSYNVFTMTSGEGFGMTAGPAGTNQLYMYAKAFNQVDVSGANTLYAYSNATLTPSFQIAATGGIELRSDPDRNIIYVDGPLTTNISSGQYVFNRFNIVPTTSTLTTNIPAANGTILAAASPSSMLTFSGVGDVILSSIYSTNQVFFTVSSYTAAGFLALSGEAFTLNSNILSTVSSLYVNKLDFSTATTLLSTNSFSNTSSAISTVYGVSTFFGTEFNTLTGLIMARATIDQLNIQSDLFTTALSSLSANYISYVDYLSSTAGIIDQVSSVTYISDISTLYIWGGTFYNFSTGNLIYDQSDVSTLSTSAGVAISTTSNFFELQGQGNILSSISTTAGLGTLGYVSTSQLLSSLQGLGTFGYVSTPSLTSSLEGLGTLKYISAAQLISTTEGLGTAGYFSTSFLNQTLASTTLGLFENLGSYGYISSFSLASTLQSTTQGLFDYMGSSNYISAATLASTLQSTTQGIGDYLGSQHYVSIPTLDYSLFSTVAGLGLASYISEATLNLELMNTFSQVGQYGFISTPNVQSTVIGLGSAGYISSLSLISTTEGLISTLSTGLALPSFKSSLIYAGNTGDITADISGIALLFSTASFNLDSFSTYIQDTTQISVDVSQTLYFAAGGSGIYGLLSTNLIVAETSLQSTFFIDATPYFNNSLCNVYSRNMTFQIPTDVVKTAYQSSYTLQHYIPNGYYNPPDNNQGYTNAGVYIGTSPSNSIFATIMN